MIDLSSAREKIARARHHYDVLQAERDTFMHDDSYPRLLMTLDNDRGECIVQWSADVRPPIGWAVRLGEFFHDLRSALDHIAHELSGRAEKSEFPIFRTESDFNMRAPGKTEGIQPGPLTIIEELQPFRQWPEQPKHTTLWQIHELNIIDKHRRLHLSDLFLDHCRVEFILPTGEPLTVTKRYLARQEWLQPYAKLGEFTWDTEGFKRLVGGKVQVNFVCFVDVSLSDGNWLDDAGRPAGDPMPINHLMYVCLDHVESIVPMFEPFEG